MFFPGSTIGNFEPDDGAPVPREPRRARRPERDAAARRRRERDRDELLRAYDDSEGVTAAFDLNVLAHVNRTHAANFDLDRSCTARCGTRRGRGSRCTWSAGARRPCRSPARTFTFARGEPIVTEHCYKHSPDALAQILRDSGWTVTRTFADPAQRMRLWLATAVPRKRGWST